MPIQDVSATLLLIENSERMRSIWPDLRDRCLKTLIDTLEGTNPGIPTNVSIVSSFPYPTELQGQEPSSHSFSHSYFNFTPPVPRKYDGFREFDFNPHPDNRISPNMISAGIDFLDPATPFQHYSGLPGSRHIIIVAASPPSEEETISNASVDLASPKFEFNPRHVSIRPPWGLLAQRMNQANISCHLVLSGVTHDITTSPLMALFDETLRLQENVEVAPWFPVDTKKYAVRLSSSSPHHLPFLYPAPYINSPLSLTRNSYPPLPVSLTRNQTMQLPMGLTHRIESLDSSSSSSPESQTDSAGPNLVSHLLQVHGLTRKKVYGAKTVREPFFRDEPLRDKYSRAPPIATVSSTASSDQYIATTTRTRNRKQPLNVSQPRAIHPYRQTSPTDLHPHRQNRQSWSSHSGSRISSPEADEIPLSSSSSSSAYTELSSSGHASSALSSPTSPTATTANPGDSHLLSHSGSLEPTWLQPRYPPVIPPLSHQHQQPSQNMSIYHNSDATHGHGLFNKSSIQLNQEALDSRPALLSSSSISEPIVPTQASMGLSNGRYNRHSNLALDATTTSGSTTSNSSPPMGALVPDNDGQLPDDHDPGNEPFIFDAPPPFLFSKESLATYDDSNFVATASSQSCSDQVYFSPPHFPPISTPTSQAHYSYGINVNVDVNSNTSEGEYLYLQRSTNTLPGESRMTTMYPAYLQGSSSLTGWAG